MTNIPSLSPGPCLTLLFSIVCLLPSSVLAQASNSADAPARIQSQSQALGAAAVVHLTQARADSDAHRTALVETLVALRLRQLMDRTPAPGAEQLAEAASNFRNRLNESLQRLPVGSSYPWPMGPQPLHRHLQDLAPVELPDSARGAPRHGAALDQLALSSDSLMRGPLLQRQLAHAQVFAGSIWAGLWQRSATVPAWREVAASQAGRLLELPATARSPQWLERVGLQPEDLLRKDPLAELVTLLEADESTASSDNESGDHSEPEVGLQQRTRVAVAAFLAPSNPVNQAAARVAWYLQESGAEVEWLDAVVSLEAVLASHPATQQLKQLLAGQLEQRLPALAAIDTGLGRVGRRATSQTSPAPTDSSLPDFGELRAALWLLADDLSMYLEQPFRGSIGNEFDICFALSRESPVLPGEPISFDQFQACSNALANWATRAAASPEAAGSIGGPFAPFQIARELQLPAFQRINYLRGYAAQQLRYDCTELNPVVNYFEWSLGARGWNWLAQRWPAYARQSAGLEAGQDYASLPALREAGMNSATALLRQANCRGGGRDSVLLQALEKYQVALASFQRALSQANEAFREQRLAPGADLRLDQDVSQKTSFRPELATVGPCADRNWCDVTVQLPASRPLFALFPQQHLLAAQLGLGQVELCYSDVHWVERRAEPVGRMQRMAEYYGRLQFDLRGRFVTEAGARDVFVRQLRAQEEHNYLLGENSEEVLDNPCPRDLIGSAVIAELPETGFSLVPRRLTYLTADRMMPARLFEMHWTEGEQWRELLPGQRARVLYAAPEDAMREEVKAALSSLGLEQDRFLYQQILPPAGDTTVSLALEELTVARNLLGHLARLFIPQSIVLDEALRGSLYGVNALFAAEQIERWRNDGGQALALLEASENRYQQALATWADFRPSAADAMHPLILETLLELEVQRRFLADARDAEPIPAGLSDSVPPPVNAGAEGENAP